jgi:hypothetical protein
MSLQFPLQASIPGGPLFPPPNVGPTIFIFFLCPPFFPTPPLLCSPHRCPPPRLPPAACRRPRERRSPASRPRRAVGPRHERRHTAPEAASQAIPLHPRTRAFQLGEVCLRRCPSIPVSLAPVPSTRGAGPGSCCTGTVRAAASAPPHAAAASGCRTTGGWRSLRVTTQPVKARAPASRRS